MRSRVLGAPEISTDGLSAYPWAIERAFGERHTLGVIVKNYAAIEGNADAAHRYSPGDVVSVERKRVVGSPTHISTSYVERQNLTLRMSQRRFTRLTNAFSKKFEHHCAAIALYAAHFNFCRVHEALRITPAMQLGITNHVWTIGELIAAALDDMLPPGTTIEFPMNLARSERIPSGRMDQHTARSA